MKLFKACLSGVLCLFMHSYVFAEKHPPVKLNNLVTELLNMEKQDFSHDNKYTFEATRNGWIYLKIQTSEIISVNDVKITVLQNNAARNIFLYPYHDKNTFEAMFLCDKGTNSLQINSDKSKSPYNIIIRAIPEIVFDSYGHKQKIFDTVCDWDFLEKNNILNNVNVFSGKTEEYRDIISKWHAMGRIWLGYAGCNRNDNPEKEYEKWKKALSVPFSDGIIIDEFDGYRKENLIYTETFRRLFTEFPGKRIYPWIGHGGKYDLTYPDGNIYLKPFAEAVIAGKSKPVLERYFEDYFLNEEEMRQDIAFKLDKDIKNWENAIPGIVKSVIVCFNFYVSGGSCSRNINPSTDYRYLMDFQFNHIANSPLYDGLYGVMAWHAAGADPETIRWLGLLYRHYCIKGKKEMLSPQYGIKYALKHLQNPDFEYHEDGWIFSPAEDGSISIKFLKPGGWWQGRKPEGIKRKITGNHFALMKYSDKKPNKISQTIENLIPSRPYTLKMISGDPNNLKNEKLLNIYAKITGAKIIEEYQKSYPGQDEKEKNIHYFNYHYIVFVPEKSTAELTITDWKDNTDKKLSHGKEVMINFIEVQSYIK
ncbi:MAG: hypothetical protein A2017_07355 [Lentisphaerae bacterium GWF2_44_16]|nr:MAG: hypothetical protein A2017_07355 [Lentisphaerae bacterium GWF2_44_16]